jgi:hypothetical protein
MRSLLRSIAGFVLLALGAVFGMPVAFGAVLTTETPVTMWDKVDARLSRATPCAQILFRGFKTWCMQHLKGINLQLLDIADLTGFTNPLDGVVRVYAVYVKKQNTGTDAFFKIFDNATNDATVADARVGIALLDANQEQILIFPDGLALAAGVVIGAYTAFIGANATTASTAGDGPNGFMLVG